MKCLTYIYLISRYLLIPYYRRYCARWSRGSDINHLCYLILMVPVSTSLLSTLKERYVYISRQLSLPVRVSTSEC